MNTRMTESALLSGILLQVILVTLPSSLLVRLHYDTLNNTWILYLSVSAVLWSLTLSGSQLILSPLPVAEVGLPLLVFILYAILVQELLAYINGRTSLRNVILSWVSCQMPYLLIALQHYVFLRGTSDVYYAGPTFISLAIVYPIVRRVHQNQTDAVFK